MYGPKELWKCFLGRVGSGFSAGGPAGGPLGRRPAARRQVQSLKVPFAYYHLSYLLLLICLVALPIIPYIYSDIIYIYI